MKKQEFYCKTCNKCMFFCCHKCATPIQVQNSEPFCIKCTKRRYYACRKCGCVPGAKDRQVCAHKGCNTQDKLTSCQQCETSYCMFHDDSCKRGWNGACYLQKQDSAELKIALYVSVSGAGNKSSTGMRALLQYTVTNTGQQKQTCAS